MANRWSGTLHWSPTQICRSSWRHPSWRMLRCSGWPWNRIPWRAHRSRRIGMVLQSLQSLGEGSHKLKLPRIQQLRPRRTSQSLHQHHRRSVPVLAEIVFQTDNLWELGGSWVYHRIMRHATLLHGPNRVSDVSFSENRQNKETHSIDTVSPVETQHHIYIYNILLSYYYIYSILFISW